MGVNVVLYTNAKAFSIVIQWPGVYLAVVVLVIIFPDWNVCINELFPLFFHRFHDFENS